MLEDLECLGAAQRGELAIYLPKARWRYLINCQWVCALCPYAARCPFGALFQAKGWPLPNKSALLKMYERMEEE